MNDTTPIQSALANATVHKGDQHLEIGPHLANILVGPIRNMRLSTDGVCIKLLTVLTSRVLHAKSLCPFGFTNAVEGLPAETLIFLLSSRDGHDAFACGITWLRPLSLPEIKSGRPG